MGGSLFNLNDFDLEAKAILDLAKKQAEEMLTATRNDILQKKVEAEKKGYNEGNARGYKEGHEKGLKDGEKAGVLDIEKKTAHLKTNLTNIINQLESAKSEILQRAESDLIRLSIEISKKITKAKFENEPELIKLSVVSAVKFTALKSDIIILVNPLDRSIIETFLPELKTKFDELEKISVVENVKIERGGCQISSKAGVVDQSVESQFQKIYQQLLSSKQNTETPN
jgi:flagellar assembly protein FliH